MALKFKVGDKVRTKKNLKVGKNYNGLELLSNIMRIKEPQEIENANDCGDYKSYYIAPYFYTEQMLTKAK